MNVKLSFVQSKKVRWMCFWNFEH